MACALRVLRQFFLVLGGLVWSGEKRLETEGCATHMLFELLNRKKVLITLKKMDCDSETWTGVLRLGFGCGFQQTESNSTTVDVSHVTATVCLFVFCVCLPAPAAAAPAVLIFHFFVGLPPCGCRVGCAVAEGILWAVSRARSFLKIRAGLFDVAALQNQEKAL